jgi:hypothetical protein
MPLFAFIRDHRFRFGDMNHHLHIFAGSSPDGFDDIPIACRCYIELFSTTVKMASPVSWHMIT